MRDRTKSRSYSPEADEFRRLHEGHRAWGLERRYAQKRRRLQAADRSRPGPATADGLEPARPQQASSERAASPPAAADLAVTPQAGPDRERPRGLSGAPECSEPGGLRGLVREEGRSEPGRARAAVREEDRSELGGTHGLAREDEQSEPGRARNLAFQREPSEPGGSRDPVRKGERSEPRGLRSLVRNPAWPEPSPLETEQKGAGAGRLAVALVPGPALALSGPHTSAGRAALPESEGPPARDKSDVPGGSDVLDNLDRLSVLRGPCLPIEPKTVIGREEFPIIRGHFQAGALIRAPPSECSVTH
jgi:hypothetical protein